MSKLNGWTIAGAVISLGATAFGIAKGIADGKEADRKQTEKIEAAVQKALEQKALESGTNT